MNFMDLTMEDIYLIAGCLSILPVLAVFLKFYEIRLISHSLRLCNWICGMAISSDSPWVKMLALHLVFFIRILMYLAIVSLEQVDRLTTRSLFKHYVSGSRVVFLEYISIFLHSSEELEKCIVYINFLNSQAKKKEHQTRK
jgi:hypothetical protein